MFRQYRSLKQDHSAAILLFRMGDFYEMFYEDAQDASRILDLTLTARGKGTDHVAPMCGFPHHQLEAYTARLVRAGRRVAICEQVEDPKLAKGLVRREVIRVVTPGTVTDPSQLDAKHNTWVAGVACASSAVGAAFLDASTGEFLAWQSAHGADPWEALSDRLEAFAPRELVHPQDLPWSEEFRQRVAQQTVLSAADPYPFTPAPAADLLRRHLAVASLDGFGIGERPAAVAAAGGLLLYLQENQKSGLEHIDCVLAHEPSAFLLLDPATRRNLEIERSLRSGERKGSLLDVLDETATAAGGRLQQRWILAPLLDVHEIRRRQEAVEELLLKPAHRREAREILRRFSDIERLLARCVNQTANARDLLSVKAALDALPAWLDALRDLAAPLSRETLDGCDPCADLAARLAAALADDPPLGVREGGVIRDGFDAELDDLRAIRRDGRATIAAIEARERDATGIASLKVRFNKVFGYYLEVSKSNLHLVPERFERKQTIASGERYVTAELKEYEAKVLSAQERIEELEYEIFCRVRAEVAREATRLKAASRAVAILDVLCAWAEAASRRGYVRPRVVEEPVLKIVGGRHPVVEATLSEGRFTPNDTDLDGEDSALAILTGPNMGGKSTYLRQVALIALMAQAGSFVPAEEAEIGIVDRIFCRVGASDSLAEGRSTFMVEMTETANILHHADARSLVLLDEIGRGTATFDGLSIAWAVVEFLHERLGGPPRTLFATHYHELTELAVELAQVVNWRTAVREQGERVVFLHRVEPGAADRSYGIHVARLAGIPAGVVSRAREILENLETDEFGRDGLPRRARRHVRGGSAPRTGGQFSLFAPPAGDEAAAEPADPAAQEVLAELREKNPDQLTPLEALQLIAGWRRRLNGERRER